ncbi:MAG: hypothetical protein KF901_22940 [Myxococcales bacterium]|nr:hypothetical protein [Myxococcales bacterium]
MARYHDPRIDADERGLSLRWYYFPFGTKRIRWDRVAEMQRHDMGDGIGGGRWRIWGSGDLLHWMPLDVRRPSKRWMFIIRQKDSRSRVCITPDDPDAFEAAVNAAGIEVRPMSDPYVD